MSNQSGGTQGNGAKLLVGGVGFAGLIAVLSATQRWVSFTLVDTNSACIPLLSGEAMQSFLLPSGILLMIAAAGLMVAPVVLQRIIGVVSALLGALMVWSSAVVLVDPLAATSDSINNIAGHFTGWLEVATTSMTSWPVVTLIVGALALILGIVVALVPKTLQSLRPA